MSVPILLTVTDANAATAAPSSPTLLDEHIKSCASYVEATAINSAAEIVPSKFNAKSLREVEANNKAACTPTLRQFTLVLDTQLESHEHIGLTGDAKALGEWQLERSVPLAAQGALQWSTNILLQACRDTEYRYFVYTLDPLGRRQIRRWETSLKPRRLTPCDGMIGHCPQLVDRFGELNSSCERQVNRGWLTHEALLQLKFEREQLFEVLDIDAFDPDGILIKLVPLGNDLETVLDNSHSGVNIDVVKLNYGQSQLRPQESLGISHRRGEVVIFHVTVPHPLQQSFALVFHSLLDQSPIGKTILHADDLLHIKDGVLQLNITKPQQLSQHIVARLNLPCMLVTPFVEAPLDFRSTYAHYWPKSWPNLDVGHRGNGRSYLANAPAERENTLASFKRAYEMHADMVEFDVHLTVDGVPIVYHDFGVRTAPHGKKITSSDQLQYVLIKDVTYDALKQLRVFSVINQAPVEYPSYINESSLEHRIFPTLIDVLVGLPKTLGMDVEIKWPQKRVGGALEAPQIPEKNFFVDRILATVIKHGCGRPLIFSSFDADICTMLRFKQNIFPVMFLTMGETKKWEQFIDLRTRNFVQAINNAQAFELAGTAPHAEDFLDATAGAQLMAMARQVGQIAIVWGDDCNSKERVQYFTDIGAAATCYDRSDLYMREGKERAFFNSSSLLSEFEGQCRK